MTRIDAVEYLIESTKTNTIGSPAQCAALRGLGEAGGDVAIEYLIAFAKNMNIGTDAHCAALLALGRASRLV